MTGKRKAGRPRLLAEEKLTSRTISLGAPAIVWEQIDAEAARRSLTLADMTRRALYLMLSDEIATKQGEPRPWSLNEQLFASPDVSPTAKSIAVLVDLRRWAENRRANPPSRPRQQTIADMIRGEPSHYINGRKR